MNGALYNHFVRQLNLFVSVEFPCHICVEGFCDCVCFLRDIYGDVVLEAHLAYVLHKELEVWDFHYAVAAEGIELVVCELAFAHVSADDAGGVVGGGSAEGRLSGCYRPDDGTISVVLADGAGDNLLVVHL